MHAISSYRSNRPTNTPTNTYTHKQTNPQTGPITIHCAATSAQCNKAYNAEITLISVQLFCLH